ncbi:hypothetical protein LJR010_000505 [Ensifer adhaerens]|uniref:hypothetical protein n=1 Tax=Ensifer adhaerens TaxID=106592 RepID=UPI00399B37A0
MSRWVKTTALDAGNLDAILAAVERGYRKRPFKVPHKLEPSRIDVEALPAGQRQAVYLPRIELRRDIDWTISGYRTLAEIGSLPWAAIAKRGDEIVRKARSFRKLITKDAAGQWWAREELPEIAAHLDGIEADVRRLNEGQPVSRDTETSALDWFVQRLTDVFEKHFKAKASRASGASGDEYYSPFVAFVIAVAEEAKIDIKPKTIHRIMAARLSMSRRVRKK